MSRAPVAVITGAQGQLGSALAEQLDGDYQVVAFSRRELDITDHQAVMQRITAAAPVVIFNAVAYTAVDAAEDDAVTAFDVNAMGVRSLARVAMAAGAVLVHYSTDFVFDGDADRPYRETDLPSPRSVYAQSKLVGEWMAATVPAHYVLRVESLFGGRNARSSIDKFIEGFRNGAEVRAFHDREVSPSFVDDVVAASRALLERGAEFGTYHCVNSGHASWLDVAAEAARCLGIENPKLVPVSVNDVSLRAPRPKYAALDNSKLKAAGVDMPHWRDALARHVARLTSDVPQPRT